MQEDKNWPFDVMNDKNQAPSDFTWIIIVWLRVKIQKKYFCFSVFLPFVNEGN